MAAIALASLQRGAAGARQCAVFVHGMSSTKETWTTTLDALAVAHPELDLRAVDLRGHGESALGPEADYTVDSMVRDLHSFVTAEELPRPFLLVGHSLGTRVVLPYAHAHPDHVCGLLLEDLDAEPRVLAHGAGREGEEERLRAFQPLQPDRDSCVAELERFGMAERAEQWFEQGRIKPQAEGGFRIGVSPWTTHLDATKIASSAAARDSLPAVATSGVPVLLLLASVGSAARPEGVQRLCEALPGMRVETVAGADHSIHRSRQEEFVAEFGQLMSRSFPRA